MQSTNHALPMTTPPIIIRHNFKPEAFMWLWAKYAVGFNERYHCTNCLRGRYSSRFSRAKNPSLAKQHDIAFDEHTDHRAIYICGVARTGYSAKRNYKHNVHIAIRPAPGATDAYAFDQWRVQVSNGRVLAIPEPASLPIPLRGLSAAYIDCRIFRWAACFFNEGNALA
jgi:hypothetical protein